MLNGLPAYCRIRTDRIDALGENRAHGTFKATSLKGSPNLGTSNLSGVEHGIEYTHIRILFIEVNLSWGESTTPGGPSFCRVLCEKAWGFDFTEQTQKNPKKY